ARKCFSLKPRHHALELCPEPSSLSDASRLMQLILPILLHLSNGSFLTVFSWCFCGIVPGHYEVFDDLLRVYRNRISDALGFRLRARGCRAWLCAIAERGESDFIFSSVGF